VAEGLARALDEMARHDVDVLVLGREGNARFVAGAADAYERLDQELGAGITGGSEGAS
jgi:hypothetical protein